MKGIYERLREVLKRAAVAVLALTAVAATVGTLHVYAAAEDAGFEKVNAKVAADGDGKEEAAYAGKGDSEGGTRDGGGQDGKDEAAYADSGGTEEEKTGKIIIRLEDGAEGTKKAGVVFAYTKVADMADGELKMSEPYRTVDLSAQKTAGQLQNAALALEKLAVPDGTAVTDANGEAAFSGLKSGAYLISCRDRASYDILQPLVVTVPAWDENASEMDYEIIITPKHSPLPRSPKMGDNRADMIIAAAFTVFAALGLIYSRGRYVGCAKR